MVEQVEAAAKPAALHRRQHPLAAVETAHQQHADQVAERAVAVPVHPRPEAADAHRRPQPGIFAAQHVEVADHEQQQLRQLLRHVEMGQGMAQRDGVHRADQRGHRPARRRWPSGQ